MSTENKVKKALIPFFGDEIPEKALKETFEHLKKGDKLYLLHITDEAPTRSIRYMTGQLGEKSEVIKSFREAQRKVQEKAAEDFAGDVKEKAAKRGISIETDYVEGAPGKEVLKAIEKYSIDIVIVEQLRQRLDQIFFGEEVDYLKENAPCEVVEAS